MVDRPGRPNSKLKLAFTLSKSSVHTGGMVGFRQGLKLCKQTADSNMSCDLINLIRFCFAYSNISVALIAFQYYPL